MHLPYERGIAPIHVAIIVAIIFLASASYIMVREFGKAKTVDIGIGNPIAHEAASTPLTISELRNAQYPLHPDEPSLGSIQLHDGQYQSRYFQGKGGGDNENPNATYSVRLYDHDPATFGDIDEDGDVDAVILLTENFGGGTGQYIQLVVVENDYGEPFYLASTELGDRVEVQAITLEEIIDGYKTLGIIVFDPRATNELNRLRIERFRILCSELGCRLEKNLLTTDVDTSSNWKTYRNEKYGYQVEYPFFLTPYTTFDSATSLLHQASADSESVSFAADQSKVFCCEPLTLTISGADRAGKSGDVINDSRITLGGKSASVTTGEGNLGSPLRTIVVDNDTTTIIITQNSYNSLLNGILSSITFFPPRIVSSDWNSYRSEKYGFELKYPSHFQEVLWPYTAAQKAVISVFHYRDPRKNTLQPDQILIRVLPTASLQSFHEDILNDVVFDGSGAHPASFKAFQERKIGNFTFYSIRIGRFEGDLSFNYYLVSEKYGVFVFQSLAHGVDWANPSFEEENESTHAALKYMLETLKFDKALTDSSNWKTYRNDEYEFKYPANWKKEGGVAGT